MHQAIKKTSFIFSLLAHLLLFLFFILSYQFTPQVEHERPPELYVPSYTYQEKLPPNKQAPSPPSLNAKEHKKTAKNGIEKPAKQQEPASSKNPASDKPLASPSANPRPDPTTQSRVTEAINLVGEKTVVKPLIEILGRALGARLKYPRMAVEFNITGTSYVGFVLHPTGLVSDVRIVKSSGAGVLDDAALAGVRDMSPVLNVSPYVEEPRFLVIGIIFGGEEKNRA